MSRIRELAENLARSLGHSPDCCKVGCGHACSCGAGEKQAQALCDYERWKQAGAEKKNRIASSLPKPVFSKSVAWLIRLAAESSDSPAIHPLTAFHSSEPKKARNRARAYVERNLIPRQLPYESFLVDLEDMTVTPQPLFGEK